MTFAEHLKSLGFSGIRVFGDSISAGFNASHPHLAWPALFAAELSALTLRNHAIPGTVLQASPLADGKARADNGVSRFAGALLDAPHRDAILILYGYNDARYMAAPDSMNAKSFSRDYANMLERLIEAGHAERLAIGSPPYIPTVVSQLEVPALPARHARALKSMSVPCASWRRLFASSMRLSTNG